MRQVPNYLFIGNGRVSQHFQHYFSLLKIPYSVWHRQKSLDDLHQSAASSSRILLLINDNAIDPFVNEHLNHIDTMRIHFSGSLVSDHAFGAHPLMTFSHERYTLEQYKNIPFVLDHDSPEFEELFPGLPNINIKLNKSLKSKYHALCVLGGNFSCMLWQKLFSSLELDFNIPSTFAHPYLLQQTQNILNNPKDALTGPLVRKDESTIKKNLMALNDDPFYEIYQSFVDCYKKINGGKA